MLSVAMKKNGLLFSVGIIAGRKYNAIKKSSFLRKMVRFLREVALCKVSQSTIMIIGRCLRTSNLA